MKKSVTIKDLVFLSVLATVALLVLGSVFLNYREHEFKVKRQLRRDSVHIDQIVKACKLYAMDWDGHYPTFDTAVAGGWPEEGEGTPFTNSTDAFNELIREVDLGTEEIFYTRGNPTKRIPPNQDGVLTQAENCFSYIAGLSDSTSARAPLVADEMIESTGIYGEDHPWLTKKYVVVGYCGGQVKIERLTSKKPGAEIRYAPWDDFDISPPPPPRIWLLP